MKKYFNQFNKRLQQSGLTLRDVEADGNCLFRAIAEQITGDEDNYQRYRRLAITSLKQNKKFFQNFLPEGCTFKQYIKQMSQDGVWGGHVELQALSNALQIDIVVHTFENYYIITHKEQQDCWCALKNRVFELIGMKQTPRKRQIHIAFHCGDDIINHYSSVRMIGDDTNKPAKHPNLFSEVSDQSTTDDSY